MRNRHNRKFQEFRKFTLTSTLALMMGLSQGQAAEQAIDFNMASMPLSEALVRFSTKTNMIVWTAEAGEAIKHIRSNKLKGQYEPEKALKLLLKDSGLSYEFKDENTVIIRNNTDSTNGDYHSFQDIALPDKNKYTANDKTDEKLLELEEVVATGTNIRGIQNSASPMLTFDKDAIDKSGFATTHQFIQSLSQNFGGGGSENTLQSVSGGADSANATFGTGVNLRGLGNDSTLVLLNGRRVAPGNIGNFVDISMIPLSAIDRIEIVADGASAIYGSDAVGGVVNVILRDDYEGAETRLRYGTVTDGDSDEYQVGQVFGRNWNSGNGVVSYEYYNRDSLDTEDRSFTADATDPSSLLPKQERHSIFASLKQNILENVTGFGNVIFADRSTTSDLTVSLIRPRTSEVSVQQLSLAAGVKVDLPNQWLAEIGGVFSGSDSEIDSFEGPTFISKRNVQSDLWNVDAKADGPLFALPGGIVRFALGGQYRKESLDSVFGTMTQVTEGLSFERDIYAVFAEVFMPIIGPDNGFPGIERLELTVAGRFENYSDFGSSTDPKVGLLWSAGGGLNVRGTYGTSFRAPLLTELDTTGGAIFVLPQAFVPNAPANVLFLNGPNSGLGPESATTWTAGFDYSPPGVKGLKISVTYYNVEFKDRIAAPIIGSASFTVFLNAAAFAPIITVPADLATVTMLSTDSRFQNPFSVPLDTVGAIVDLRTQNLATTNTDGLDVQVSYNFETDYGVIGVSFNGTYILNFDNQLLPTAPSDSVLNTTFNPVDFRFRSGVSWSRENLSINAFVNHVDDYLNTLNTPEVPVDSWTTVDLTAKYNFQNQNSFLKGTSLSVNVINLFDEDPPFVENLPGFKGFDFDGANANALGRFVSFQITKEW